MTERQTEISSDMLGTRTWKRIRALGQPESADASVEQRWFDEQVERARRTGRFVAQDVEVSPELAVVFLANNVDNRRISDERVYVLFRGHATRQLALEWREHKGLD